MEETVFWYGQTTGLVLLVAEPEELLVLHSLLEAVLHNCSLSSGHIAFSVHVALFLCIVKLPPSNL